MITLHFNQHKRLLLVIVLCGLITAIWAICINNRYESIIDRSFLTEQPCKPPCWYGLELDKANEEDVRATLKALPFIDQSTIREWSSDWLGDWTAKEIHPECIYPTSATTGCVGLLIYKDKLKAIRMSVAYELTFGVVVERLGPPDYMYYGPYHPEVGGCVIILEWPMKGINVEHLDTHKWDKCEVIEKNNRVDRTTKVSGLFYTAREGFRKTDASILWPGFTQP